MSWLKSAGLTLLVLVAGVPLAGALTLTLLPFWRWLEAASPLESVGHSGPATWCYISIYALLIGAFWVIRAKVRSEAAGRD